jgi:hypothetical protein
MSEGCPLANTALIRLARPAWSIRRNMTGGYPDGEVTLSASPCHLRRRDQLVLLSSAPSGHLRAMAASVPDSFPIAVKVPEGISHERRLKQTERPAGKRFLSEVSGLGPEARPAAGAASPQPVVRDRNVG